jgi:hypothetical protein
MQCVIELSYGRRRRMHVHGCDLRAASVGVVCVFAAAAALFSLSLSLHLFYPSVMAAADVSNEQALLLLLPLFQ